MSTDVQKSIVKAREERVRVIAAAQELLTVEDPTAEQRAEVDSLLDTAEELGADLSRRSRAEELSAMFDRTSAIVEEVRGRSGDPDAVVVRDHDQELRGFLDNPAHTMAVDLGVVVAHRRNMASGLTSSDILEKRAYQVGVPNKAGYTVPTIFETQIYDALEYIGGIRGCGPQILTTPTGAEIKWVCKDSVYTPSMSDDLETAEGKDFSEHEFTVAQRSLYARKYTGLSYINKELLRDSFMDVSGEVGRDLGEHLAKKTGLRLSNGTGVNMPMGPLSSQARAVTVPAAAKTVTSATADSVSEADLFDVLFSLDPAYLGHRPAVGSSMGTALTWSMHQMVWRDILKLRDSTGVSLFMTGLAGPVADTLLGLPVVPNVWAEAAPTGDGDVVMMLGAWRDAYIIRQVSGVEIQASNDYRFISGQVTVIAEMSLDGQMKNPGALCYLINKA